MRAERVDLPEVGRPQVCRAIGRGSVGGRDRRERRAGGMAGGWKRRGVEDGSMVFVRLATGAVVQQTDITTQIPSSHTHGNSLVHCCFTSSHRSRWMVTLHTSTNFAAQEHHVAKNLLHPYREVVSTSPNPILYSSI